MIKKYYMRSSRIIGLDIFRILLMLIVFAYHANLHLGILFSVMTDFVSVGALCMTGFFMLSGSVIYIKYSDSNFNKSNLFSYYLKRICSIYPLYFIVLVLYSFANGITKSELILLPVELLGLQSAFLGSFNYSFNGGAWFVSCLLFCYLVFPLISVLIKKNKPRMLIVLGIVLSILIIYSQLLCGYLSFGEIYSNPIIRCFQFSLGCVIGALIKSIKLNIKSLVAYLGSLISFILLVVITSYLVSIGWVKDFTYLQRMASYDIVAIPCFVCIIFFCSNILLDKLSLISKISNLSFSFFLSQLFVWKHSKLVFDFFSVTRNYLKILICFLICLVYSLVLHYFFEKPIKKYLLTILYNKRIIV